MGFQGDKNMGCEFKAAFLLLESSMPPSVGVEVGGHDQTQALVYTSQVPCS